MPEIREDPVNREPNKRDLIKSFLTEDGYDRNHSMFPGIDGETHNVRVDGAVSKHLNLSMSSLRNDFTRHSVVCALQCAGNRRHTMRTKIKEVSGIDWFDGAVMNCKWSGPLLKDVLERAGINLTASEQKTAHVAFACNAVECQEDTWYGASIPLSRAMNPEYEVILALEKNDEPLSVGHGYPVRAVTPGIAGARAVKWLDRITVQTEESNNHYMQHDYKALPPEVEDMESAKEYWDRVPPVQEMPVNSVIAVPDSGETIGRNNDGTIVVQGYALPSGDDGPVIRVEVSNNDDGIWQDAELLHFENEGRWSWKLWKANFKIEAGQGQTIYSRATDAAGNTQPELPKWNLRGVCYNGYGDATDLTIV